MLYRTVFVSVIFISPKNASESKYLNALQHEFKSIQMKRRPISSIMKGDKISPITIMLIGDLFIFFLRLRRINMIIWWITNGYLLQLLWNVFKAFSLWISIEMYSKFLWNACYASLYRNCRNIIMIRPYTFERNSQFNMSLNKSVYVHERDYVQKLTMRKLDWNRNLAVFCCRMNDRSTDSQAHITQVIPGHII